CRRSERMWCSAARVEDMDYFHPSGFEEIGDQTAMAAPPHCFRAHHGGGAGPVRNLQQSLGPILKSRRLHVIGIAAKRVIPPRRISRVRTRFASPAQLREVFVIDTTLH